MVEEHPLALRPAEGAVLHLPSARPRRRSLRPRRALRLPTRALPGRTNRGLHRRRLTVRLTEIPHDVVPERAAPPRETGQRARRVRSLPIAGDRAGRPADHVLLEQLRHRRVADSRRRRLEVSRRWHGRAGLKMPRGVPQRRWRARVHARESKAEHAPRETRSAPGAAEHFARVSTGGQKRSLGVKKRRCACPL